MNKHMMTLGYFPEVSNHIADDPTPRDQAVFVPAISPGYAIDAFKQDWSRPLPGGLPDDALNFLDPANKDFFSISHALSSAGQALNQKVDCIVTARDRTATTLICDSGGYQIASGRLDINGDADRLKILRWMEKHGNYAMTLDVPTGPVLRDPNYRFRTVQDCLSATLDHLTFFEKHRVPGKVELLNVLQGNTPHEADAWYDAVKDFRFEGWAFAGILRKNMYQVCRRIIIMMNEGRLTNKSWIHVLGTAELETAVLLTALQRAINKYVNPHLRISYDAASPFRMLVYGTTYTTAKFSPRGLEMQSRLAPNSTKLVGTDLRWPWPSPIGDRMTVGDVCVNGKLNSSGTYDKLSRHLLVHHNLSVLCHGIATANRVFDTETVLNHDAFVPHLGAAVEAIDRVIAKGTLFELAKVRSVFGVLKHGHAGEAGEEHRLALE